MDQDCKPSNCSGVISEKPGETGSDAPVVSVVVAARNEAALIRRCLAALGRQSFSRAYEVIVVDNGSTDSTACIAGEFACRVVNESATGQLSAKHRGVVAATGEIVAVIDADCVPASNWLSSIYCAFASDTAKELAAVTARYRYERGMPWWAIIYAALMQFVLLDMFRLFTKTLPFVVGGNVAFRRDYYTTSGGYPQRGGLSQTELGLARNLKKCGLVRYVGSMEVLSSPRRFQQGPIAFFLNYKMGQYFKLSDN